MANVRGQYRRTAWPAARGHRHDEFPRPPVGPPPPPHMALGVRAQRSQEARIKRRPRRAAPSPTGHRHRLPDRTTMTKRVVGQLSRAVKTASRLWRPLVTVFLTDLIDRQCFQRHVCRHRRVPGPGPAAPRAREEPAQGGRQKMVWTTDRDRRDGPMGPSLRSRYMRPMLPLYLAPPTRQAPRSHGDTSPRCGFEHSVGHNVPLGKEAYAAFTRPRCHRARGRRPWLLRLRREQVD